jgi:hypothetical protein
VDGGARGGSGQRKPRGRFLKPDASYFLFLKPLLGDMPNHLLISLYEINGDVLVCVSLYIVIGNVMRETNQRRDEGDVC